MNPARLPAPVLRALARLGVLGHWPRARQLAGDSLGAAHLLSDRVLGLPLDLLRDPALGPAVPGDVLHLDRARPVGPSSAALGRATLPAEGGSFAEAALMGDAELRRELGEWLGHGDDAGWGVALTRGGAAALGAVFDAFVNPGQAVLVADPTSPVIPLVAKSRRARVRHLPTEVTADGRWTCNAQELVRLVRGVKLVVLCDPAHPTGASPHPEVVEPLAWAVKRYDCLVVIDETYAVGASDSVARTLAAEPSLAGRVVRVGSLSAGLGVPALKVGWVSGSRGLVGPAAAAHALGGVGVCPLATQAVGRAWRESRAAGESDKLTAKVRLTRARLSALGLPHIVPASGAWFWVDVTPVGLTGRAFAERLLAEEGVAVGAGEFYGPSGVNRVRVSAAEEEGRLREGLARLARFVSKRTGAPSEVSTRPEIGAVEVPAAGAGFSRV